MAATLSILRLFIIFFLCMLHSPTIHARNWEIARRNVLTNNTQRERRMIVDAGPPTSCGKEGSSVLICSPTANDTWVDDGTFYTITWNPTNSLFDDVDAVDIYLIFPQNYTNSLVKTWFNQSTSSHDQVGNITVQVDRTWFPSSLGFTPLTPGNQNQTFKGYFIQIVPSGHPSVINDTSISSQKVASSQYFAVMEIAPPSNTSTSTTVTPTSSQTFRQYITTATVIVSSPIPEVPNSQLEPWQIALLSIAGAALFLAAMAIAFVYKLRRSNQRKVVDGGDGSTRTMIEPSSLTHWEDNSPPLRNYANQLTSSGSFGSTTPFYLPSSPPGGDVSSVASASSLEKFNFKTGYRDSDDLSSTPLTIIKSNASQSNPAQLSVIGSPSSTGTLSNTDARLIAETFRQRLRKPEWDEEDGEDSESDRRTASEEKARREVGERLLKAELAEEGKSIRSVLQMRATVDDRFFDNDTVEKKESQKGSQA